MLTHHASGRSQTRPASTQRARDTVVLKCLNHSHWAQSRVTQGTCAPAAVLLQALLSANTHGMLSAGRLSTYLIGRIPIRVSVNAVPVSLAILVLALVAFFKIHASFPNARGRAGVERSRRERDRASPCLGGVDLLTLVLERASEGLGRHGGCLGRLRLAATKRAGSEGRVRASRVLRARSAVCFCSMTLCRQTYASSCPGKQALACRGGSRDGPVPDDVSRKPLPQTASSRLSLCVFR